MHHPAESDQPRCLPMSTCTHTRTPTGCGRLLSPVAGPLQLLRLCVAAGPEACQLPVRPVRPGQAHSAPWLRSLLHRLLLQTEGQGLPVLSPPRGLLPDLAASQSTSSMQGLEKGTHLSLQHPAHLVDRIKAGQPQQNAGPGPGCAAEAAVVSTGLWAEQDCGGGGGQQFGADQPRGRHLLVPSTRVLPGDSVAEFLACSWGAS